MPASIILPEGTRPTNLHLRESVRVKHVEADLFNICERIKEVSPRLYIVEMTEADQFAWAIMEKCDDGVDRLVFRTKELDGRVLEKLRRLMAVDLHTRIEILDREREKLEAEQYENDMEELYERLGGPMMHQLARDGFLRGPLPRSVRPMNRTARRHGRRMS